MEAECIVRRNPHDLKQNDLSAQILPSLAGYTGIGSLIVALAAGEKIPDLLWIGTVMVLGFVAYGLSINFYIKAQKDLGAAKTSAYYSIAPFLGVLFGALLLREQPGVQFYVGLAIMIAATVLMVKDTISLQHTHEHSHTHTHEHRHGDLVHTHEQLNGIPMRVEDSPAKAGRQLLPTCCGMFRRNMKYQNM